MAIPDSTTATPFFLEEGPDWSKPYMFDQDWKTFIKSSHNSTEQRTKSQNRPRYKIAYLISSLTIAEYSVRRARAIRDTGRNVVVPIWHAGQSLSSMASVNVANFAATLTHKQFKVGSYAYFVQTGKTSVFRKITFVATNALTMAATPAAFPVIAVPSFTAGAVVYPCILGRRGDQSAFDNSRAHINDESVSIEEL